MAKNLSSLVHELRERIAASSSTPPLSKNNSGDDDALEIRFRAVIPNLLHTYVNPSPTGMYIVYPHSFHTHTHTHMSMLTLCYRYFYSIHCVSFRLYLSDYLIPKQVCVCRIAVLLVLIVFCILLYMYTYTVMYCIHCVSLSWYLSDDHICIRFEHTHTHFVIAFVFVLYLVH